MPIEVREVRKLCQSKSLDAYRVVVRLMEGADKDSVKLAAALAVLRMAGVPMSELKADAEAVREATLTPQASEAELMEAAAKGEA